MSLLMDALKRAEEAKRLAAAGAQPAAPAAPAAAPELSLDPLDAPATTAGRSLPPLSQHLDSLDADLAASAAAPPSRRSGAGSMAAVADRGGADDAARMAVKNAFAVKQEARPRTSLWLFIGLGGAVALAIAGYFWWQLQGLAGGSRVAPPPLPAARQPVLPAVAGASVPLPPASTATM
ncbi:MAG: hypothetical protein JNN21_03200, partial [Candidatus Accumulibacter sp.]|nr:hypothetical protein [Accumulibacter sp.]